MLLINLPKQQKWRKTKKHSVRVCAALLCLPEDALTLFHTCIHFLSPMHTHTHTHLPLHSWLLLTVSLLQYPPCRPRPWRRICLCGTLWRTFCTDAWEHPSYLDKIIPPLWHPHPQHTRKHTHTHTLTAPMRQSSSPATSGLSPRWILLHGW